MHDRAIRPIRGFTWRGWLLLAAALLLAWCGTGGFDLQHALVAVCFSWLGERWVWDVLIRRLMFGAYWASLTGVVCGPLTLMSVLVAMHLSPRRWGAWAWGLVALWLVLNPWICFEIARGAAAWLGPSAVWLGGRPGAPAGGVGGWGWGWGGRIHAVGDLLGPVLIQLVPLAVLARLVCTGPGAGSAGRRRRLIPWAILALGCMLGTFQWWLDWPSTQQRLALGLWAWAGMGAVWHAGVSALLIGGAWAARRRALAQRWVCRACGYDCRGLPEGSPCPECGAAAKVA